MGFEISGVNHQDLWLCGIGCWQLGKDQINHIMGPDPREHLEPPQQSEEIRLGVNWYGKGGSEGAAVGLQRWERG